jgi:sugar/nucleoside kinase (ribokinase family)
MEHMSEMSEVGRDSGGGRVILVSTHTVDHLPLPDGRGVRDIPGGPATYVGHALGLLGRPYTLITGSPAEVQVIPHEDGQEYLIPAIPPIPLPERLAAAAVVISPIVGEVPPHSVPPVDGLLVLDLQGFVREPGRPTSEWVKAFELTQLLERADVVKASAHELQRLTPDSLAALRGSVVLETLGRDGLMLCRGEFRHHIEARHVESDHTIGAGDTLLAGFVDSLLRGMQPVEAARCASEFTASVLQKRSGQ